jgi:putative spermidine/putrescine transport system ATP-binding protein
MPDLASMGSLQIKDVSKMFGTFQAVNGVNLDIQKGEFLTLLGPSGSGKTTLLMMIAGFMDLSHGDIALMGLPLGMSPRKSAILAWCFRAMRCFHICQCATTLAMR